MRGALFVVALLAACAVEPSGGEPARRPDPSGIGLGDGPLVDTGSDPPPEGPVTGALPPAWEGSWQYYSSAPAGLANGYALEWFTTTSTAGAPITCGRISGDYDSTSVEPPTTHRFGLSRTLSFTGRARVVVSYRASSGTDQSQVTNAALTVGDQTISLAAGGATDTGWQIQETASLDFSGSTSVRISLADAWAADWNQQLELCGLGLKIE
jgi:hypothetical protein